MQNILPDNYYVSFLPQCNSEKRMKKWIKDGGRLKLPTGEEIEMGCGINSLAFLRVITRTQGSYMLSQITEKGTTFLEMMNYVFNANGKTPISKYNISISTFEEISKFVVFLQKNLCANCCTIVKLMRVFNEGEPIYINGQRVTVGHSVVFYNKNGDIHCVDPHTSKTYNMATPENIYKAYVSWDRQQYIFASVMIQELNAPIKPVKQTRKTKITTNVTTTKPVKKTNPTKKTKPHIKKYKQKR